MPRAQFTKIETADETGGSPVLDRHIGHVAEAFKKLGNVVNNDRLLTFVFTTANQDVTARHNLGFPITSYDIVRKNAASDVFEVTSDAVSITLRATLPCTIVVRVH